MINRNDKKIKFYKQLNLSVLIKSGKEILFAGKIIFAGKSVINLLNKISIDISNLMPSLNYSNQNFAIELSNQEDFDT